MKSVKSILLIIILTSITGCNNEPVGKAGYEDVEIIHKNSKLFSFLLRTSINEENDSINSIECIKFNYPLLVYIYDENEEYIESRNIESNNTLYEVLTYVEDQEYQIGINYPLYSLDAEGNTVEITNNNSLQEAIQQCVNEASVKQCNSYCSGITDLFDKCYWKITNFNNQEEYLGDLLYMDNSGGLNYFHNNIKYEGSWLAHTDENDNQLYINLFIDNEGEMELINKDWKVLSDFNGCCSLKISNNDSIIIMEKKCIKSCSSSIFTVCSPTNTEEVNIALKKYLPCLSGMLPFGSTVPVEFNFYESLNEAQEETDSISTDNYTLLSTPQTIYLKTKSLYSANDFQIDEIILEASENCD